MEWTILFIQYLRVIFLHWYLYSQSCIYLVICFNYIKLLISVSVPNWGKFIASYSRRPASNKIAFYSIAYACSFISFPSSTLPIKLKSFIYFWKIAHITIRTIFVSLKSRFSTEENIIIISQHGITSKSISFLPIMCNQRLIFRISRCANLWAYCLIFLSIIHIYSWFLNEFLYSHSALILIFLKQWVFVYCGKPRIFIHILDIVSCFYLIFINNSTWNIYLSRL